MSMLIYLPLRVLASHSNDYVYFDFEYFWSFTKYILDQPSKNVEKQIIFCQRYFFHIACSVSISVPVN